MNFWREYVIMSGNIFHLHCSGEELKHCVEPINKGVKALEDEGFLKLPRTSGLPLVCEVGGQSYLVFLKGGSECFRLKV